MNCASCGKSAFVTISGKKFCSSCGVKHASSKKPKAMSDIKQSAEPLAVPTRQATKAALAAKQESGVLDLRGGTPPAGISSVTKKVTISSRARSTTKAMVHKVESSTNSSAGISTTAQTHPLVKRFPQRPSTKSVPTAQQLPNHVEAQISALQMLTEPEGTLKPVSPAQTHAASRTKRTRNTSIHRVAAGLAALALMASFVWLQNAPKLAFHAAAGKAGIDASLPTFIPSSFRQTGPASVSDGQLVLSFASPSSDQNLAITQRRTNWDSQSLLDNFIVRQSDKYQSIQGQGLTIYVYGDHANWVNHGVWYTIDGTAKMGQDQMLKIAYGL